MDTTQNSAGRTRVLTAAEVRGSVLAYYRIDELMNQPLTEETKMVFKGYLDWVEEECTIITGRPAANRWARDQVGPVLAAATGACARMRGGVTSAQSALRIFDLVGDRPLSVNGAWALVQPYLHEPVLSPQSLAKITRQTTLRLKLPQNPTAVDVLDQLTRQRGGAFPVQVAHWLAEYFINQRGEVYLKVLADIESVNDRGELAQIATPHGSTGRLEREDWEALMHGRLPRQRIEFRAGYSMARTFVAEYWDRWNARK